LIAMPITFTYDNLTDRQPWKNVYYNVLKDNIASAVGNLDGTDLKKPFTLGGNINGAQYAMFRFRKWMGNGSSDVGIRDICGYGAVMDGATDDAAAIQAAIDDLPSTGGCIMVPPGTAMVSTTLLLSGSAGTKNNVTLMGFGNASILKLKANAADGPLIRLGYGPVKSTGMQVRDLRCEGNSANNASATQQCGISMENSTCAMIANLVINDFKQDGIEVSGSDYGSISACTTSNNSRYGIGPTGTDKSVLGLRVSACSIRSNTTAGIFINSADGFILSDCDISLNTGEGILVKTVAGVGVIGVNINGCTIRDNGADGLKIINEHASTKIEGIVLDGCYVFTNTLNGITISGKNGDVVGISAMGNIVTLNQNGGFWIDGDVKYGTIFGNSVFNNSESGSGYAGVTIGGANAGTVEFISITGNSICNENTQVDGVVFRGMAQNNVCAGNTIYGNTVSQVTDLGTNNDVSHNVGA
jgi:parallel beta-helix repeat protein